MSTYTHTSTFTSTRIEVVAKQFERGLLSAGISQKRIDKILTSIKEQKLSAIGIYALDSDKKRVAEVEISVDWTKHRNQIKIYGDQFEYLGAINRNTGEAAEPKVYVNSLVQLAKENDFELGCWIRASDSVRKNSQDYKKLMKSLGFGGEVEDWKSYPDEMSNETLLALEEMKVRLRGVSGNTESHNTGVNQRIQRKINRVKISLVFNIVSAIVLSVILILSQFNAFHDPWYYGFLSIPLLSYLIYFFVGNTWGDDKYGGWTKYDTTIAVAVGFVGIVTLLANVVFKNNLLVSKAFVISLHAYIPFVLALTTYRDVKFLNENGVGDQWKKSYQIATVSLYVFLSAILVMSAVNGIKEINPLNVGESIEFGTYEQDDDLSNGDENIKWTIHDIKNGKALLVCDICIEALPYNDDGLGNSWTNSDVRRWLNADFFESAFSAEEKKVIIESNIVTRRLSDEDGHTYGETYGDNEETTDQVFILDLSEFWQITNELEVSEIAKATFMSNNSYWGQQENYQTMFWIRSPYGERKNYACGYDTVGEQSMGYIFTPEMYAFVRPAIYIDVELYDELTKNENKGQ